MKKYYNIHTHIFNAECAPSGFYGRGKKKLVRKVTLFPKVSEFIIDVLETLDPLNSNDKGNKLAKLVQIGTEESQEEVLLNLINAYRDHSYMNFVVLSLDMDFMGAGSALVNYPTQLLELRRIKGRYGDRVKPFVCIDPRRFQGADLVNFVNEHITKFGFAGIKMYPALGFYPFDPALYELYEYAERFQIPIMTHCDRGGINYQGKLTEEHINPQYVNVEKSTGDRVFRITRHSMSEKERRALAKESNDKFCDRFTDPVNYEQVLEAFPRLKLCFAHFGGADEIVKKPTTQASWYDFIKYLISGNKYENVYADVSYTLENLEALEIIKQDMMSDSSLQSHVLFGTDFFVVNKKKTEEEIVSNFQIAVEAELFDKMASDNAQNYLAIDAKVFEEETSVSTEPVKEEQKEEYYDVEGKVKLKKSK